MFGNKGIVEDIPDGITKIRLWRELLATCNKIKKPECLIDAAMFLLLNKTEHFVLKKKHAESEPT